MNSLPERLREMAQVMEDNLHNPFYYRDRTYSAFELLKEAAKEIERWQAEVKRLEGEPKE